MTSFLFESRATSLINIYLPEHFLINTPNYTYVKGQVFIDILYFSPSCYNSNSNSKISNFLTIIIPALSELFSTSITLRITRIYYPFINSIILGKYFVNNSDTTSFKKFFKSLGKTSRNPEKGLFVNVTGIRIKISGRLRSQPFIPKYTTESLEFGIFNHKKYFIDNCEISTTNSLGTFTLFISLCQKIS